MASSTITIQKLIDEVSTNGDIAPVLSVGGKAATNALTAANEVITAMINGGPETQAMPWKWNRIFPAPFYTNSWQQDYAFNNLNISYLENATAIDTNSTSVPKQVVTMQVRKDLLVTNYQFGIPNRISWEYNSQLQYGTWGGTALAELMGLTNPGPTYVYTNPVGAQGSVNNAITQVKDSFGNLWKLTTFGTCGSTNPFSSNLNPVFPTVALPNQAATTATDGSCVWTAINPDAQGFRLSPIPNQTGRIWLVTVTAQATPILFTSLAQTLSPVPNEYYTHFKRGFIAHCYAKSPDKNIRAKFADEYKLWMTALDNAVRAGTREQDEFGFTPGFVLGSVQSYGTVRADQPYGPNYGNC